MFDPSILYIYIYTFFFTRSFNQWHGVMWKCNQLAPALYWGTVAITRTTSANQFLETCGSQTFIAVFPTCSYLGLEGVSFTKYPRGSWILKSLPSLLKWNYQTTSFNQHRSPGQPIWQCLDLSERGCVIYVNLAQKWTYICVSIGQGNFVVFCITTAVCMEFPRWLSSSRRSFMLCTVVEEN